MDTIFWTIAGNQALILSHYSIVPAIAIGFAKGYVAEVGSLLAMTLVSTMYHLCQAGNVCALPFSVLQIADHFFVYSTLTWLILFFTDAKISWRFVAFMLIQGLLLPMIISYIHEAWLVAIAVLLPAGVGVFYIILMGRSPRYSYVDLGFSIGMIIIGVAFHLFAGDPGSTYYAWLHSVWHVACMLSIYFLFESKDDKIWYNKLYSWCSRRRDSGKEIFYEARLSRYSDDRYCACFA